MKPFSWSWSRLKNYRVCPKRHWHVDIQKDFKEVESEALLAGNNFHQRMASYIEDGDPLPTGMEAHSRWPSRLRELRANGVEVKVEMKLAMSANFKPTSWFENSTWCRGVVDAAALDTDSAVALDWKTGGKMQPEFEQLGITASLLFAHYPSLKEVHTSYYWSQFRTEDRVPKTYTPDSMLPLWGNLLPEIKRMEEAHRTTTYPPKPSGLCVKYCPVRSCAYHGKGSRG